MNLVHVWQMPLFPRWRMQDIDTEEDWRRAELLWDVLRHVPEGLRS